MQTNFCGLDGRMESPGKKGLTHLHVRLISLIVSFVFYDVIYTFFNVRSCDLDLPRFKHFRN